MRKLRLSFSANASFFQFSTFKSASEGLPDEERKAFAEKIALAFYKSLGGDSESDSDCPPDN